MRLAEVTFLPVSTRSVFFSFRSFKIVSVVDISIVID